MTRSAGNQEEESMPRTDSQEFPTNDAENPFLQDIHPIREINASIKRLQKIVIRRFDHDSNEA